MKMIIKRLFIVLWISAFALATWMCKVDSFQFEFFAWTLLPVLALQFVLLGIINPTRLMSE